MADPAEFAALQAQVASMRTEMDQIYTDMDTSWLVLTGAIVFFMQAGFSMLESGAVSSKNVINILFKNVMDGAIAAICFWICGFGIGFGDDDGHGIVGTNHYGLRGIETGIGDLREEHSYANFFFQWAFAGTAATIVSGSVAERTKFEAYLLFSAICSILIYPPVVHWIWGTGFLAPRAFMKEPEMIYYPPFSGSENSNGVLDYGGSGVVHMLGGFSGLMGAIALGPRRGRFDAEGRVLPMPPHNTAMMALGATILWFGWYAFNCGSTLMISHHMSQVAGKIAVNTTIAGATGALMATVISRAIEGTFDIGIAINGLLAGLVGITASCAVVDPWAAFVIGCVAPWIYYGAHRALLRLHVDDPLDAFPIHGCCGAFGLLSVGIFCQDRYIVWAGYPHDNDSCSRGEQFAIQLVAMLIIATWALLTAGLAFYGLKATIGIRVPDHVEDEGLDCSEHGGNAYFEATPATGNNSPLKLGNVGVQGSSRTVNRRVLPAEIPAEPTAPHSADSEHPPAPSPPKREPSPVQHPSQQNWVAEDLERGESSAPRNQSVPVHVGPGWDGAPA